MSRCFSAPVAPLLTERGPQQAALPSSARPSRGSPEPAATVRSLRVLPPCIGLLAGVHHSRRSRRQKVEGRRRGVARRCTGAVQLSERSQQLVFFGGKGGVGKTSCSAAYAAGLADQGLRTLILSTDPAHSLGDALKETLTGEPKEISENLYAMEIDSAEALAELREGLKSLDAKAFLDDLGLPGGTTAALGLDELSELLESPPPGVDELTAIARVAAQAEGYDVLVFDTAPTGHTLRLLEVPTFLGDFIDKALTVRKSVMGILGPLGFANSKVDDTLDKAEVRVREIRTRIAWLQDALKTAPGAGKTSAEFVAVTRPTPLDCAEVERLIKDLQGQGVSCKRMVINQVIGEEAGAAYWKSRIDAQGEVLSQLRPECASRNCPLIEVPERPESLVGTPALGYLATVAFNDNAPTSEVTLFGGKGGVGKTSMSSAFAVRSANEGEKVLAVSTDPAHSLGDALGVGLGEEPRRVDTVMGAGELWAMEVDTAGAMQRFQATVREALQVRQEGGGMVGEVLKKLPMGDFVDLFDTLPPGSDEVVALVELLDEVESKRFDRLVIDMAPTGHALRLLGFPNFLERLADRVARLRDRFGWLAGDDDGPDALRTFQFRMIKLQDLFTDPDRTSFAVVAIPTNLALAETKRLLGQLEDQDIKLGMVIANRVLDGSRAEEGVKGLMEGQQASLQKLEALAEREGLAVTKVPLMDRELQGIYGLKYLGMSLVNNTA